MLKREGICPKKFTKLSVKGASTANGFIYQKSRERWKYMKGEFFDCFLGK